MDTLTSLLPFALELGKALLLLLALAAALFLTESCFPGHIPPGYRDHHDH